MRKSAGCALLAMLAFGLMAADTPAYRVTARLAGPAGSYDYTSVDPALGRVYIGRSFGVETLDLKTGRFATLLARRGVAAVMPIGASLMLSTNGDQNSATLFDRRSGHVVADIRTGSEPDGASYDAASGTAFVANGESRSLTVIDVAHARAVATIRMDGAPEGAVSDEKGRLFVNLEDRGAIAVVDIAKRAVVGRYALPGCTEPTGIAFDPVTHRLISACHNGVAKMIDAGTGADRGSITIGKGADGSLFDPVRRLGFVPCIDGTLTVYSLDKGGKARVLQTVHTAGGARTAAYDSAGDRLYLPLATVERDAKGDYLRAQRNFAVLRVARR